MSEAFDSKLLGRFENPAVAKIDPAFLRLSMEPAQIHALELFPLGDRTEWNELRDLGLVEMIPEGDGWSWSFITALGRAVLDA